MSALPAVKLPMNRPLILVTNDDGVHGAGNSRGRGCVAGGRRRDRLRSRSRAQRGLARVDAGSSRCAWTRSNRGSSPWTGRPPTARTWRCLHLAPRKPALCVSGINHGYNLGSDVFYSGTVAGAVEAALRGVPAVAISLERRSPQDFSHAAAFVRALAIEAIARGDRAIPPSSLLSVNLPHGKVTGYQVTFLGRRVYRDQVDVRQDLRGRSYYWIGGPEENATDIPGSDCSAVRDGLASITPLSLDLTHAGLLDELHGWNIGSFVRAVVEGAK